VQQPVTALQLQRLLDRAGLSQRGAAKALEINERTMRKYVSGDSPIPLTVEYALRWVTSAQEDYSPVTRLKDYPRNEREQP
jgi:plasmid maintenance system antidote protein VapI